VSHQVSRNLLILALSLPAAVTATTPWDCTRQADGLWKCTGKSPPAATETAPEATGTAAPTVVPAESPIEPAAPPAEKPLGESGTNPPEPVSPPGNAAEPETPSRMSPGTAATVPTQPSVQEAGGAYDEFEVENTDLWALCPPVAHPAPLQATADTDTINLQADEAHGSKDSVYTLEGNAVAVYAGQRLEADNIVYRQEIGRIEARNGIRYTKQGLYARGESATFNLDREEGELSNVDYVLYEQHGRGAAESSTFSGTTEQHLTNAFYTTCPEGNSDWVLSARKVDLDQETGTGTARDAKLSFKGVPFLYTPYATFPIDDRRKSGLLLPRVGQTEDTGLDISTPVYWNIAPNRDMTIIPRYLSDRGAMLGTEYRYLYPHSSGRFTADYLPSDKLRNDDTRSLVSLRHHWTPMPRLRTNITASDASDVYYFEDLGNSLLQTSQTNLERTAAADYYGDWWNLGMMVQDYQTVSPTIPPAKRPYKQLPQIVFNATPEQRLLGIKVEANAELNYFKHSDTSLPEGSRVDIQPRLSLPVRHAAWYVEPAASVRYTAYNLDNTAPNADKSPSRTTPIASLDTGMFFERNGSWGDRDYVQTLEPRLFYLYVPKRDQDNLPVFDTGDYDFNFWTLFRENRFSGPDRMGDANQLAMALTTRILDPASGRQALRASLGSLLYFRDRTVTLPGDPIETTNSSNLIGELGLALSDYWNADAELHWDPHDSTLDRNDYRLQYIRGPRQQVNLSYRERLDSLEQADLSFLWPLSPKWHLVGRWYYALDEKVTIEVLGGVGYESCCWSLQLLTQSYISNTAGDRNNSIYLQLELKGLGMLGNQIDDALDRAILRN